MHEHKQNNQKQGDSWSSGVASSAHWIFIEHSQKHIKNDTNTPTN